MHRIWYGDTSIVTADRVALAVLEYARILAVVDAADVVEIPGVIEPGRIGLYRLLLGPASQMVVGPAEGDEQSLDASPVVEELERRGRSRLPSTEDAIAPAEAFHDVSPEGAAPSEP